MAGTPNATVPQIVTAMTAIELAGLSGLVSAFADPPDRVSGAYPCTINYYISTKKGKLTMPSGPIVMGGSSTRTDVYVHQFVVVYLVGERGDQGTGELGGLTALAKAAVDPYLALYTAHNQLGGIVLSTTVLNGQLGTHRLSDGVHFGVYFELEIVTNPTNTVGA